MFFADLKGFKKKLGFLFFISLFFILTLSTSGVAAVKIANSFSNPTETKETLVAIDDSKQEEMTPSPTSKINPSPTQTAIRTGTKAAIKPNSTIPTSLPSQVVRGAQTSAANTSTSNTNNCIITLSGQQYDVTTLRQTHSGGDVFQCGADMTAVYQKKHGSNLSMMQKYLVTSAGTSITSGQVTQVPQASITKTENKEKQEEEDD